MNGEIVTRFAPSPTGYLHIGHAYSALDAWHRAATAGGRFILRIEDIDGGRCKPDFEDAIYEDLAWLGLTWESPVRRQSEHLDDYAAALAQLHKAGMTYPCFCTRGEIKAEIERMGGAPHLQAGGAVYPGTCLALSDDERQERLAAGKEHVVRLRMEQAAGAVGALHWHDVVLGDVAIDVMRHGDIVLARKDIPTSYHLSVTVDDAKQGITLVTRGEDLVPYTDIHRVLQALLGLNPPIYHHHKLLTDKAGRRLAKRDRSLTLRALRLAGATPEKVRTMAGFTG
jgi:glutamyl-Q tRNA(Asp) synthetase